MREGTKKLAEEGAPLIAKAEDILIEWGMVRKFECI
jgi:predicted Rossmann fold nucleotide-binding protein DprA/Smf involved in DNA uptake